MADQGHKSQGIIVAVRSNEVTSDSLSPSASSVEKYVLDTQAGWREIVGIIINVATALDHAYEQGQIHGTLKTKNIKISQDANCVFCEFSEDRETPLSSYTAPEQLTHNESRNRQTELYRLGVVFYKLLTNREPFRALKSTLMREQIRDDVPQPPRQLIHGLPKELDSICLRLLAKSPADRIDSGKQLADDLQLVLRQFDERVEPRSQSHNSTGQTRNDLVIIRFETIEKLNSVPSVEEAASQSLTSSDDMKKLFDQSNAIPVSWDGDELLFQLSHTVSHDDAIGRVVTIGAGLLDFAFGLAQQSRQEFKVNVESAELDHTVAETDRCRSVDLIRRVPRVVGQVSRDHVQVDNPSWHSLRRWVEHTAADDVAELQIAADKEMLRVHIQPPQPLSETAGPQSPLAIVKARWEQAKVGMGQMVLIIGEEGTGKTRLVDEVVQFAKESEPPEIVKWNCIPGRQGRSFHPWARSLNHNFFQPRHDRRRTN